MKVCASIFRYRQKNRICRMSIQYIETWNERSEQQEYLYNKLWLARPLALQYKNFIMHYDHETEMMINSAECSQLCAQSSSRVQCKTRFFCCDLARGYQNFHVQRTLCAPPWWSVRYAHSHTDGKKNRATRTCVLHPKNVFFFFLVVNKLQADHMPCGSRYHCNG